MCPRARPRRLECRISDVVAACGDGFSPRCWPFRCIFVRSCPPAAASIAPRALTSPEFRAPWRAPNAYAVCASTGRVRCRRRLECDGHATSLTTKKLDLNFKIRRHRHNTKRPRRRAEPARANCRWLRFQRRRFYHENPVTGSSFLGATQPLRCHLQSGHFQTLVGSRMSNSANEPKGLRQGGVFHRSVVGRDVCATLRLSGIGDRLPVPGPSTQRVANIRVGPLSRQPSTWTKVGTST